MTETRVKRERRAVRGDVLRRDRPWGVVDYLTLEECREIDGDEATYPSRTVVVAELTTEDDPERLERDAHRMAAANELYDRCVEARPHLIELLELRQEAGYAANSVRSLAISLLLTAMQRTIDKADNRYPLASPVKATEEPAALQEASANETELSETVAPPESADFLREAQLYSLNDFVHLDEQGRWPVDGGLVTIVFMDDEASEPLTLVGFRNYMRRHRASAAAKEIKNVIWDPSQAKEAGERLTARYGEEAVRKAKGESDPEPKVYDADEGGVLQFLRDYQAGPTVKGTRCVIFLTTWNDDGDDYVHLPPLSVKQTLKLVRAYIDSGREHELSEVHVFAPELRRA